VGGGSNVAADAGVSLGPKATAVFSIVVFGSTIFFFTVTTVKTIHPIKKQQKMVISTHQSNTRHLLQHPPAINSIDGGAFCESQSKEVKENKEHVVCSSKTMPKPKPGKAKKDFSFFSQKSSSMDMGMGVGIGLGRNEKKYNTSYLLPCSSGGHTTTVESCVFVQNTVEIATKLAIPETIQDEDMEEDGCSSHVSCAKKANDVSSKRASADDINAMSASLNLKSNNVECSLAKDKHFVPDENISTNIFTGISADNTETTRTAINSEFIGVGGSNAARQSQLQSQPQSQQSLKSKQIQKQKEHQTSIPQYKTKRGNATLKLKRGTFAGPHLLMLVIVSVSTFSFDTICAILATVLRFTVDCDI